jgi:hypothetical protein
VWRLSSFAPPSCGGGVDNSSTIYVFALFTVLSVQYIHTINAPLFTSVIVVIFVIQFGVYGLPNETTWTTTLPSTQSIWHPGEDLLLLYSKYGKLPWVLTVMRQFRTFRIRTRSGPDPDHPTILLNHCSAHKLLSTSWLDAASHKLRTGASKLSDHRP